MYMIYDQPKIVGHNKCIQTVHMKIIIVNLVMFC